jgi:hypothetical protein
VKLIPFCPFSVAKLLALKATVLLLLTLLIKARVQIVAGSSLGIFLLLLQTLAFLAVGGSQPQEQRFTQISSAALQWPERLLKQLGSYPKTETSNDKRRVITTVSSSLPGS